MVKLINDKLSLLKDASIEIIKRYQSDSGAYQASPHFAVYDYSWFRDGSFIAEAMSVSGENESALNFHNWATRVILEREEKIASLIKRQKQGETIANDEHLHCRFTLDGKESSEVWTNLQLDGFGSWIFSLDKFSERGNTLPLATFRAVEVLIAYLATFWQIPSFDWWEENFGHQHVASLGSMAAGLSRASLWPEISSTSQTLATKAAADIMLLISNHGLVDGHLAKWIDGEGLDASLVALIAPFALFDASDEIALSTINAVSITLGRLGTFRHLEDEYFGGGRWPLLSCFLGLALVSIKQIDQATEILTWVGSLANEKLELPEQLPEDLQRPHLRAEWIARWGEPAIPLLWSHAMFLSLYYAIRED